jgi:hypothetical protein
MTLVTFWLKGYMIHSTQTGRWSMMKNYLKAGSGTNIGGTSYNVLSVDDQGCVIRVNVELEGA